MFTLMEVARFENLVDIFIPKPNFRQRNPLHSFSEWAYGWYMYYLRVPTLFSASSSEVERKAEIGIVVPITML